MRYEQRFAKVLACVVGAAWLALAPPARAGDTYEWCRIVVESTTPKEVTGEGSSGSGDETARQHAPTSTMSSQSAGTQPVTLSSWYDAWRQLVAWLLTGI